MAGHDLTQLAESSMTQPEEWDEFIGANDFVLLVDQAKYWMIRVSDISTLEACGDYTRAHLRCATPPIRRPLGECERRLDPSLFFSCQRRLHRQPRANESNPHARSVSTCLCSPGLPRDFCFLTSEASSSGDREGFRSLPVSGCHPAPAHGRFNGLIGALHDQVRGQRVITHPEPL